jgi:hypothetical protein
VFGFEKLVGVWGWGKFLRNLELEKVREMQRGGGT